MEDDVLIIRYCSWGGHPKDRKMWEAIWEKDKSAQDYGTKEEKAAFLFQSIDKFFNDKIELILGELKPNSKIGKDDVANLLLEVYNRSSTQTKALFPCPMCHNLKDDCMACDLLVQEIESYK